MSRARLEVEICLLHSSEYIYDSRLEPRTWRWIWVKFIVGSLVWCEIFLLGVSKILHLAESQNVWINWVGWQRDLANRKNPIHFNFTQQNPTISNLTISHFFNYQQRHRRSSHYGLSTMVRNLVKITHRYSCVRFVEDCNEHIKCHKNSCHVEYSEYYYTRIGDWFKTFFLDMEEA